MNGFIRLLAKEKQHFNRLNANAQRLLSSIFLYNLIGPIFGVFINAFLWRQSHDVTLVALYNLALFAAVTPGFYLNGVLMRKFTTSALYTFGLLVGGLTIATLIFLPQINLLTVLIFGFLNGITVGLYWANRNLLTLQTTKSDNRIYFSGIESASQTITNILIPLLIGCFITFGTIIHLYSPLQGYQMLAMIMLLVIGFVGIIMRSFQTNTQTIPKLFLKNASASWNKFRLYELILGFLNGATAFLPTLIVLSLLGKEDTLGTIQAFAAALTAIIVYTIGKHLDIKHRVAILSASVVIGIVGAGFLSITYSPLGVFVFFASQALCAPLIWIAVNSLNYDLIDNEDQTNEHQYAYVCDQEIYLNAGRMLGIIAFLLLVQFVSGNFGLRFGPLLFAVSQILLIIIALSIEKHHKK